jgi:hypothetical protein
MCDEYDEEGYYQALRAALGAIGHQLRRCPESQAITGEPYELMDPNGKVVLAGQLTRISEFLYRKTGNNLTRIKVEAESGAK